MDRSRCPSRRAGGCGDRLVRDRHGCGRRDAGAHLHVRRAVGLPRSCGEGHREHPAHSGELLAARPDLVVGWNWVTEEPVYDEFIRIAPYVGLGETEATAGPGFESSRPLRSWDTLFLSVCDTVNRRAPGKQLVAELQARLDELADRRSGEPVTSVARIEFYEP